MKFVSDYQNRPISQYIQTLFSLQTPALLESLLLQTVYFVPGEKKALKLSLNSTSSDNRQPVNMDTFYGPLSADIKEVGQHHIFMNTREGNHVGINYHIRL